MKVGKKELWQLLKFWLCTQIAVVADAGSFAVMYALAPAYYMLCKALSYCIGAVVSYFTNRRFTFQTTQSQRGIIWKFTVVNLVSMGGIAGGDGNHEQKFWHSRLAFLHSFRFFFLYHQFPGQPALGLSRIGGG